MATSYFRRMVATSDPRTTPPTAFHQELAQNLPPKLKNHARSREKFHGEGGAYDTFLTGAGLSFARSVWFGCLRLSYDNLQRMFWWTNEFNSPFWVKFPMKTDDHHSLTSCISSYIMVLVWMKILTWHDIDIYWLIFNIVQYCVIGVQYWPTISSLFVCWLSSDILATSLWPCYRGQR